MPAAKHATIIRRRIIPLFFKTSHRSYRSISSSWWQPHGTSLSMNSSLSHQGLKPRFTSSGVERMFFSSTAFTVCVPKSTPT